MRVLLKRALTLILYAIWWFPAPRFKFLLDRRKSKIHLTRYYMYKRIEQVISNLALCGNVLAISGGGQILEMIKPEISRITQTEYPDVDMLSLPYDENKYDVVISDQVLEHVLDPQQAVAESIRVAKPGGIIIHTSCFLNPIHPYPVDLWRFAPAAYAQMCKEEEIIEIGGWGNRTALLLMFLRGGHFLIPKSDTHPLNRIAMYNDAKYPIVTWVVARKN